MTDAGTLSGSLASVSVSIDIREYLFEEVGKKVIYGVLASFGLSGCMRE